jgi:hypothetical protein
VPDLLILGRGIAGVCAWLEAVDIGLTVELVGGHPAASAAALAVVNDGRAADWYAGHGFRPRRVAMYSTYRTAAMPRLRHDIFAVDPLAVLAVGERHAIDAATSEPLAVLDCRAVAEGGSVTYGATWFHPDPAVLATPDLRVHLLRPYTEVHAVAWPGGARIGSTSAKTPERARQSAGRLMDYALERNWTDTATGWTLLEGARVRQPQLLGPLGGSAVRFGGFHRSGYTAAALYARQAVKQAMLGAGTLT